MVFNKVGIGTIRLGLKYISERISKEPGKAFMIQRYHLKFEINLTMLTFPSRDHNLQKKLCVVKNVQATAKKI